MPRVKKDMSASAMGMPTEKTMAPQPPTRHRHSVMDGIVKGVSRGVHTPVVDGILKSCVSGPLDSPTLRAVPKTHPVIKSATKAGTQVFGSIPYAMGKGGGL